MKIAIDIQGIQSVKSRQRGIGRYSLEVVKNLIFNFQNHEFLLVANSTLPDLRLEFDNQLNYNNVKYLTWYAPGPFDYISKNKKNSNIAKLLRSYLFSCLDSDIILITSFFEGFSDNCLIDFDRDFLKTPIVSIFYDLIPLLNPNQYLQNNPDFAKYYKQKLKSLKELDGLLAISQSSRNEAIKYLKYDPKKVFNISSACDKTIFNSHSNINRYNSSKINLDLISPYIMYSGASDPRKNIRALLKSYSQLPKKLRKYKLVLVGKLYKSEIETIDTYIKSLKIDPNNVIKTGYISDIDLAYLYRKCSLFVFPSLHEGFGLPVLEAMSCGAPVIGSNRTSIPEVIGLSKAMFDPTNTNEMTNTITIALTNTDFINELRLNSELQSKRFDWSNTVESIMTSFNQLLSERKKYIVQQEDSKSIFVNNKSNLNLLFRKLKRLLVFNLYYDKDLDFKIIASIDKINQQIESLSRSSLTDKLFKAWRVEGPFDSNYSLAILNRHFAQALDTKILSTRIYNTEGYGDYNTDYQFLEKYPKILELLRRSKNNSDNTQIISRNLYPPRVIDMNGNINILHSYGWEESEFPKDWVDDFNSCLQGLTVMSNQVKSILINNGVKVPIRIAGLGLDHISDIKPSTKYKISAKKYKFLHVSSCFPRKGIDILLKAYSMSFTSDDQVSLVIKTFDNPHNNIINILNSIKQNNPLFPDVIIINDDLSDNELKSLYLQSDVLVAPSRGEGFGLPIAEAMFLDIPVITTNWGGQKDFCNDDNSWLIDYRFESAKSHFNLDLSYWAEPDVKHFSKIMNEIYKTSKSDLNTKTDKAKELISTFTWDRVANENIKFVKEDLLNFNNTIPKIGWVTSWSFNCGISGYSDRLIKYMDDQVTVFSPLKSNQPDNYAYKVIPTWSYPINDKQDLNDLYEEILHNNITTLVIQFNFTFFKFSEFKLFLHKIFKNGIYVSIFLHSTNDINNKNDKKLSLLVNEFRRCSRIFVHAIEDLNNLKNIGLIENVCIFPHGIIDSSTDNFDNSTDKTFSNDIINIVSYGFCLPNKGFKELIVAADILKSNGINFHLTIHSSIYNDSYLWVYEDLLEHVNNLGLGEFISISNKYIPSNQIVSLLSQSDLIVYPYQHSNESSSASVRDGLATLKPVMVTPISLFDDVSNLVDYFSGISPEDLANGMTAWCKNNSIKDERRGISSERKSLICNRYFSKISYRLSSIIRSIEINN